MTDRYRVQPRSIASKESTGWVPGRIHVRGGGSALGAGVVVTFTRSWSLSGDAHRHVTAGDQRHLPRRPVGALSP